MDYDTLQVVLGQSVGWVDGSGLRSLQVVLGQSVGWADENGLRSITSGVGTKCRMGG